MIIRGATEEDIRAALSVANYAFRGNLVFREEPEPLVAEDGRSSWLVLLSVENPHGPGCRRGVPHYFNGYRARLSRSACYHAYRDYLYALYERAPEATVSTELATYDGVEHFEASYGRTGSYNVGSLHVPVTFEEACDCRKFPEIEENAPTAYLGKYALEADRGIYEGLKERRTRTREM